MSGIHLCQPDATKSCAACCGIYNYVGNHRATLAARFDYRTRLFAQVRSGALELEAYRDIIRRREDGKRIYTTIYTCEFVGYLDAGQTRVGCLLHPLQNAGRDLRVVSFYGRDICEGHFCPSYQKLTDKEARCVIASCDDWYLYGAVITDIDFVKCFFRIVQDALGEEINPERIRGDAGLRAILRRYFDLKTTWPFRDQTRPRFGKYYFVGEEYDIDRIDYAALGAEVPVYDPIFLSLASHFKTKTDLDLAKDMLDVIRQEFVHAYTSIDRADY